MGRPQFGRLGETAIFQHLLQFDKGSGASKKGPGLDGRRLVNHHRKRYLKYRSARVAGPSHLSRSLPTRGVLTMEPRPLYLNGQWQSPGPALEVTDPATGETIGAVATVDGERVRQAIDDAQAAFPTWRRTTALERSRALTRIADAVEARAEEIAQMITRENGKPLPQARGEMAMTVDHFRWFAEEARHVYGRVVPHQLPGKRHLVFQHPVGVVGAIAPWNFPVVLAARKVAPALAAGCPVILKPASATPLSSVLLTEAIAEADLPPGVFQLVAGNAAAIAEAFFSHPHCRKVTFTGSTEVGKQLIRQAADTVTRLSLELGGHAPVLVFDDADLEAAVEGVIIAKFRNTGQSCIAANRVYVQQGIYDTFVSRLVERARELKIGPGTEEGVEIGPLIDERSLQHALDQIEDARRRGAVIHCGGKRWEGAPGTFLEPTVITGLPEEAACLHLETFAPVAPVMPFESETDGLARANDTPYGLAAYVFTQDLARAWRCAEELEAGTIGINDSTPATSQCPFGGMKESGLGRELGSEGIAAYLEPKHISFARMSDY